MADKVVVRLATPEDAAKLLPLYAPFVRETAVTFEYEVPEVEEFADRIRRVRQDLPWLVCEINGQTAGYSYASHFRERAAFGWDCEFSIYLHKDFFRAGVGSALFRCIKELLTAQGYCRFYSMITYPNPQSVEFHRKNGWQELAVYPQCGYKHGSWHDLLVMQMLLQDPMPGSPQPPVAVDNLPPDTVKNLLHRAEQEIKEAYKKHGK